MSFLEHKDIKKYVPTLRKLTVEWGEMLKTHTGIHTCIQYNENKGTGASVLCLPPSLVVILGSF